MQADLCHCCSHATVWCLRKKHSPTEGWKWELVHHVKSLITWPKVRTMIRQPDLGPSFWHDWGRPRHQAWSGSKLFDTDGIPERFLEKYTEAADDLKASLRKVYQKQIWNTSRWNEIRWPGFCPRYLQRLSEENAAGRVICKDCQQKMQQAEFMPNKKKSVFRGTGLKWNKIQFYAFRLPKCIKRTWLGQIKKNLCLG